MKSAIFKPYIRLALVQRLLTVRLVCFNILLNVGCSTVELLQMMQYQPTYQSQVGLVDSSVPFCLQEVIKKKENTT